MKCRSKTLIQLAALVILIMLCAAPTFGDTYTWTGATSTNFAVAGNWLVGGNIPAVGPGASDDAVFGGTITANQPALNANQIINSISFQTPSGNWTLNAGTFNLTINSAAGISTVGQISGTNTISGNITLGAAQTWVIGTGGTLAVSAVITGAAGNNLTVGTSGNTGVLALSSANTYAGSTTINFGTIQFIGAATSGSYAWFDASDLTTFNTSTNGAAITSWTNKGTGGATINASKLDTGTGPTLVTNALNGRPIMRCTAVGLRTVNPLSITGNASRTIFVVGGRTTAGAANGGSLFEFGANHPFGITSENANVYLYPGTSAADDIRFPAQPLDQYNIFAFTFDGPTNTGSADLLSNTGTPLVAVSGFTTPKTYGTTINTTNVQPLRLGYRVADSGNCNVAEVLVYNSALSAAARTNVENYLKAKWLNIGTYSPGVTSNVLPTGTAVTIGASGKLDLNGIPQTIASLAGAAGASVTLGGANLTTGDNTNTAYAGTLTGTGQWLRAGTGTFTTTGVAAVAGFLLTNGTTILDTGGGITTTAFSDVGQNNGDIAALTIQGGATVTVPNDLNVAENPGAMGLLTLSGGTLNANRLLIGRIGNATTGAFGVVNQSGGIAGQNANGGEWQIGGAGSGTNSNNNGGDAGGDANCVGIYNLSGGTLNCSLSNLQFGAYGKGALFQSGGALNSNFFTVAGRYAGGFGVIDVSGGNFNLPNTTSNVLITAEGGTGVVTVRGTGTIAANNGVVINNAATGTGIVNVLTGGTLTASSVGKVSAALSSTFNFNGGVLSSTTASTTFLAGLTNAFIYPAGAIINSNFNITIPQPLLAPTDSGVVSVDIAGGGAGYQCPPIVQFTGGAGTSSASAVAIVSGGTITGIIITNPGTYTVAPTVAFFGGNPITPAFPGNVNLAANTAAGGLTKSGVGTLTLNGNNTYGGTTTLGGGILNAGSAEALNTSAAGGNVTFTGGSLQYSAAFAGSANSDVSGRIKNSTNAVSIDTNSLNITLATAIDSTNTGGLFKLGAGTLTLSGNNTYTGMTSINMGTVQVQGADSGSSGPLGNAGTPASAIIEFTGGTLQYSATNNKDYSNRFAAYGQNMYIDTNGQSVTFASAFMSGTGGTLILSDTAAQKGSLFINGTNSFTGLTYVFGGDLRGNGALASNVQTSAASVWPGLSTSAGAVSAGEIFTVGGLDLSGGGKLKIGLNSAATQQLVVTGNTILSGGTLSLGIPNSTPIGTTQTVLTSVNAINGSFSSILLNGDAVVSGGGQITVTIDNTVDPKVVKVSINGAVTPVTIDSFDARAEGVGALLSWHCASEFQNAGFNVYRRGIDSNNWTRVNPALIAGRVTNPDAKMYQYFDFASSGVYEYKLESVGLAGQTAYYQAFAKPVAMDSLTLESRDVSAEGIAAVFGSLEAQSHAELARAVSRQFAEMTRQESLISLRPQVNSNTLALTSEGKLYKAAVVRSFNQKEAAVAEVGYRSKNPAAHTPSVAARWFTAVTPSASPSYTAVKIVYSDSGVLLVPKASLPAGFDINHVAIQREGRSVTALCVTPDGLLLSAPGYEDDYTNKDVFFLRSTNTPTLAGAPSAAQGLFSATNVVNTHSPASVTINYHDVYFDYSTAYRPFDFAPWFSNQYLTDGSSQRFAVSVPSAGSGAAELTVNLWSLTQDDALTPDHALQVVVNGLPIGQAQWEGGGKMMQLTFQIPPGVLVNGDNKIDLVTPAIAGAQNQIAFLHSMTVSYTRSLDGSKPVDVMNDTNAAQLFEVSNLPGSSAWVVDMRYPDRATLVPYSVQQRADGTYTLRFNANAGGTGKYQIVPAGMENKPVDVSKRQIKPVKSSTYLAVGPNQFNIGIQPLLAQRAKEGIKGQFVDQEQLFDYYNYGRYGPAGIQKAVQAGRPQYLLLLGRTTYDYKNFSALNLDPMCPAFLVATSFWAQTTSDAMFGDLGRGYSEVAIGRLPVGNTSELTAAVRHILNYRGIPASGMQLHAVADKPDAQAGDFGAQVDAILKVNHPDIFWQENYLERTCQTSPEVTAAMKVAANGGADVLLYSGHGNASRLGNESPNILDQTSVQQWTGNTVFLQATCTANWAAANIPGYKSIAMQALTQPQGGISASIGTSTYMNSEAGLNFMNQLLNKTASTNPRWGNVLMKTQQWAAQQNGGAAGWYLDLSKTEQLFGDPAMPVYTPQNNVKPTSGSNTFSAPAAGAF